jgi:hypothetical protein
MKGDAASELRGVETLCKLVRDEARSVMWRDYGRKFPNGRRDFSYVLSNVLKLLDEKGCDAVTFSLFSIIPRKSFNVCNVRMIYSGSSKPPIFTGYQSYPRNARTSWDAAPTWPKSSVAFARPAPLQNSTPISD